ncbi:hypothetical protein GGX14DRAFT_568895 [Mycena pura]|uniref:Secreted protein n=1 Tax=Mycena pura TaxID=153505 RepID=A0AAD6VCC0_9AGAR|nr:hypothetical protein GGX14DRAFT_568895 [Mycena pura]
MPVSRLRLRLRLRLSTWLARVALLTLCIPSPGSARTRSEGSSQCRAARSVPAPPHSHPTSEDARRAGQSHISALAHCLRLILSLSLPCTHPDLGRPRRTGSAAERYISVLSALTIAMNVAPHSVHVTSQEMCAPPSGLRFCVPNCLAAVLSCVSSRSRHDHAAAVEFSSVIYLPNCPPSPKRCSPAAHESRRPGIAERVHRFHSRVLGRGTTVPPPLSPSWFSAIWALLNLARFFVNYFIEPWLVDFAAGPVVPLALSANLREPCHAPRSVEAQHGRRRLSDDLHADLHAQARAALRYDSDDHARCSLRTRAAREPARSCRIRIERARIRDVGCCGNLLSTHLDAGSLRRCLCSMYVPPSSFSMDKSNIPD